MSSDVVLSAALRANLLSLQNTQKSIDGTQLRLSTGKKVNSALDNPQSFFAAQALTNRAGDLTKLLDSLSQSIQVIKAADNGVTALTTLINSAQSLANTAQSTLSSGSTTAKVSGTANLGDGSAKYTSFAGAVSNDTIVISVTDNTGAFGAGQSINASTITILNTDTINDVVTKVNDLNTTLGLTTSAIKASLDSSGHLSFEAVNGGNLNVKFVSQAATTAGNLTEANVLGFGTLSKSQQNGAAAANSTQDLTVLATNTINSKALYTAVGTLAQGSTKLSALVDSTGAAATVTTLANTGDSLVLTVAGKSSANLMTYGGLNSNTQTVQGLVDAINRDSSISSLVSASFDSTTGKLMLTAKDSSATDVQVKFGANANAEKFNLGFGINTFTAASATDVRTEDIYFGAAAGTLASLQNQFNTVRTQIDALVTNGDTGYAGTNLLNGNNLVSYFNETRTSSLTTSGVTLNSSGLGLTAANFQSASSITSAITQTNNALTTVRNFGSTLATNLSIIQSRQDFTTSLISTLNTGASALTDSDQNEEGAKLLALQTRQSLGVTALSLASQSQQSILRLFG